MSSVSVSVAAANTLTVLTPEAAIGDSVTPSSESNFSGVLDASLPSELPAQPDFPPAGKELPAESSDPSASLSGLAETAADILMTLQVSRDMSSSLQRANLSLVANQSTETTTESSDLVGDSSEITAANSISKISTPMNAGTDIETTLVQGVATKSKATNGIPPVAEDHAQTSDVATVSANSVADMKSIAPMADISASSISSEASSSPLSSEVKHQASAPIPEDKAQASTDLSSKVAPKREAPLQAVSVIKSQATQRLTSDEMDKPSAISTDANMAVENTAEAVSVSTDKIDKTAQQDHGSVSADPAMAAMLATFQSRPDNNDVPPESSVEDDSETISDAALMSAMSDVNGGPNMEKTAVAASAKPTPQLHVEWHKNSDKSLSSAETIAAKSLASNDAVTSQDEKALAPTIDQPNDVSSDQTTTNYNAPEVTTTQSDRSSSFDVSSNKELAATNGLSQDNNAASTTGKTTLSSTSSLPEQSQSLRNVSEQLPSLYVKNGHVEEHELAARVMLMVGQKWQEAEIELEPQGMGKIRVQLSIDKDQQTNVQFMVQHSQAKEALDQSMPRLRELLTQHGLQPGQTQVQQQTQDNSGQSWNQQMANNSAAEQQEKRGSSSSGNTLTGSKEDDFVQTVTVSAADAAGIDFYA